MIIIDRPGKWRNGKERPTKPIKIKGQDWTVNMGGLTVFSKKGEAILSLADGHYTRVRRG